ncbi:erythromycin esterase family protein [Streptomyces sp. NPDC020875]|uniref:erythromycin esterase family protein n=1 Tax=Streptomyces sp. NPDC020875 TaxID=3154898 RepID=UPI0033F7012F
MDIDLTDSTHAVEAAAVMSLFPTRPRLLALGEPTHGEDALLDLRNDLFRQLVEQQGYRTIVIESDCLKGLAVDAYVTSGTGTLDTVMERGFSHGFGGSAANRELVRWMRAFNDGRSGADLLRFAGFDGPLEITGAASPRRSLMALYDCLAAGLEAELLPCSAASLDRLLGTDEAWVHPAAMMDPVRSTGRSPRARELRLIADDLVALVHERAPELVAAGSRDEWDRARMYGRTATGLLRYHYWMAEPGPSRMTRLLGLRDTMMAENLLALAERGPALVFAHNAHLQRRLSGIRMGGAPLEWWSAGAQVSFRLGEEYGFLATALGTLSHHEVGPPAPDTLEGLLYALPEESRVVDARRLAGVLAAAPLTTRVSPWFGYAPLDPSHLPAQDGIVFVRDVTRD